FSFFFQAEDGIRDRNVTGVQTCALPISPLEDRCLRIARRLKRWNRLQTTNRAQLKIALLIYCFPPNKGNIGTAADLDVFASLVRSEERRVGKEWRCGWWAGDWKKMSKGQ